MNIMSRFFHVKPKETRDGFQELVLDFLIKTCPLPALCREAVGLSPLSIGDAEEQRMRRQLFRLVVGDVQGGKSKVIAMLALYYAIVCGEDVCIVLRNCRQDEAQLREASFEEIRRQFSQFAERRGACLGLWKQYRWPDIFYTGRMMEMTTTLSRAARTAETPEGQPTRAKTGKILFCIAHKDHVHRAIDILVRSKKPFHLIVDESDLIMYAQEGPVAERLDVLTDEAKTVTFVTATAHEVMKDERFLGCNILRLPRHPNYKSFDDLHWVEIAPKSKNVRRSTTAAVTPSPLEQDPDLWRIVLEREAEKPLYENQQPPIGLIKTESVKANQEMLAMDIHDKMPNKFLTVIFNSDRLQLCCPAETWALCRMFAADKVKFKLEGDSNIIIRSSNIRDVLLMLRENGWMIPIVIISDFISKRGMNLRDAKHVWHLTFQVLRVCKSTIVPSIHQDLRILGIYNDNIPLTLYCDKELYNVARIEFKAHEELIERSVQMAAENPELTLPGAVTDMPMDARKTTKRKQLRHGAGRLPVQVVAPSINGGVADGGFEIDTYGIAPPARPASDKEETVSSITDSSVPPIDPREFHRLTNPVNGMFKKWAKLDNATAIARFMRDLEPETRYRKADMLAICGHYHVQLTDICDLRNAGKHRHGHIMTRTSNGSYMLHPSLRLAFQQHF